MEALLPWAVLIFLILIFLLIDLGFINRISHVIGVMEAVEVSITWIALSLCFNGFVWYWKGADPALAFFTGYLLEKLLSLDNMFVFVLVFKFFSIPPRRQPRILLWGVLGAIILRLILILIGIKLIEAFEWILYLFGAVLIYSSYKIYRERNHPVEIETNSFLLWSQKWIPLRKEYKGSKFFLHINGKWLATPALLALLTIEVGDVVFAIDSIPAIFAVTLDPFIVFTSNIFAILGLRSLYFLLAHLVSRFYYLQHALAIILGFMGFKLVLANHLKIPLELSLCVIVITLMGAVLASFWKTKK